MEVALILIALGVSLAAIGVTLLFMWRASKRVNELEEYYDSAIQGIANLADYTRIDVIALEGNVNTFAKDVIAIRQVLLEHQKLIETEADTRRRFQEQANTWFDGLEENLIAAQDKLDKIKLPKTWGKMRKVKVNKSKGGK